MLLDRSVTLVVAARFISRVGGEAAFFVGIWGKAAFDFDAGPGGLAVLMAALSVSSIFGTMIAGTLVDRFDPRRVIIAGELFFVPAALSVVLAGSLPELVLYAALLGFFGAPVLTAITSFAPYLTADESRLAKVNSLIESAGMAAFIAGPAAGALIVRYASIDWIFVVDAATSAVAAALIVFVAIRVLPASGGGGGWSEVKEGFAYTYTKRSLRYLVLMATALWFTFGSFGAVEPLFYRDVLGVDVETLGWVNAVFGFGLVGGSLAALRLRRPLLSARGIAVMTLLNGAAVLLYVGTDRLRVVVLGAVVFGFFIGLLMPMLRTLIHLSSPEQLVGRISGTVQVHAQGGQLIPLAIVPALAGVFGVQRVLLGAGTLLAVVALAALREAAAVDRLGALLPPASQSVTVEPLAVQDEPISPTP